MAHFRGVMTKGVQALAFSPNGSKLAAVGRDISHTLAIFDVYTGATLSSQKGDSAKILDVGFVSETELVTAGIRHFKFWERRSAAMKERRGLFGKHESRLGCLTVGEG